MKLARFRISGEGEWEKEWKRLSGWSRIRSGDGAAARPACVREREGPCLGIDRARDVDCCCKGEGRAGRVVLIFCRLGLIAVDLHLRRGASWRASVGLPLKLALNFFRHLWHVKPDCIACTALDSNYCLWSMKLFVTSVIEAKTLQPIGVEDRHPGTEKLQFPIPHSQDSHSLLWHNNNAQSDEPRMRASRTTSTASFKRHREPAKISLRAHTLPPLRV